eukprot:TRINITY_DN90451_c0_g1_i1.p3 TRINITY_DN90451_c0_g1~~TRINITY_DN90451_c0_g1_i1.p3  ORF type:complete len:120 (-),score=26.34 TRINITY_DN90451_c0_g1_i1:266-625(-)
MLELGGTPPGWDTKWRANGKLRLTDPGVELHESFCWMLYIAVQFDQLNLASLASAELMMRELMMIEERRRDCFVGKDHGWSSVSSERSLFWDCSSSRPSCALTDSSLSLWVPRCERKLQ